MTLRELCQILFAMKDLEAPVELKVGGHNLNIADCHQGVDKIVHTHADEEEVVELLNSM